MTTGRHLRRAAVALLALVTALLVPARPAAAHTRTQETTNLDSRITDHPDVPGVTWRVHTGGLLVELTNHGERVVVVEGYEGEPYLRIGPDGVEHNRLSPATYLNDPRVEQRISTRSDVAVPDVVDPSAPPEWVHVDSEPRALWHDHRVHFSADEPPRFVEAGPLARMLMGANLVGLIGRAGQDAGVFGEWTIPFTVDGEQLALDGAMAWDDPPSPVPYMLLAALLLAPALLALRGRDQEAVLRAAAWLVLAVATVNCIHLVDDVVAWPSPVLDELFGILHTTLFLGTGIAGGTWALRNEQGRALAVGIASGALFYHQGVVHLPMLWASHFPTVWPEPLVRTTLSLGLVQAVAVAALLLRARQLPPDGGRPAREDAVVSSAAGRRSARPSADARSPTSAPAAGRGRSGPA